MGPTAVGKSLHAMELCRAFGGVILSADSRQVYRYLDICTAKPSPADRAAVPHYMIDVVEPEERYTAHRFADEGSRVLAAAAHRFQPVFVVGGTGFYVSMMLDRRDMPSVIPNETLRSMLRREAEVSGAVALHGRLQSVDPVSAARIHPNNLPRVIRALEIVESTGLPVSGEGLHDPVPTCYLGLRRDRTQLHEIADRRIDEQVRLGLVEEAETLLRMGYPRTLHPLTGLGYRQMIEYIHGEISRADAIARYKVETHQYIRRQLTWFRKNSRIEWFDVDGVTPSALHERVERYLATASKPASAKVGAPAAAV